MALSLVGQFYTGERWCAAPAKVSFHPTPPLSPNTGKVA
jgi:hypothetical protein